MFSQKVLFLQILFFQSILFLKTDEYELQIVSTTEIPSKSCKEPHQVDLILEVVNEIKSQLEEMRKEILTLKEFEQFKNWSKNNIQTQWQKFEQKQKDQNNYTKNSHNNLQKLIESMLQNQFKQDNSVNEIKSQLEATREEILTLKKQNNLFDQYKKSLETKIDLLISHNYDTKAYMENVTNKLDKLTLPKTCKDVQEKGNTVSGVYTIWPELSPRSFDVWCDMETRGGGWIYVINRFDGSVNFNLSWIDYKNGFGSLNGEHWLGLEHLYLLTKSKPNELLIELVDQNLTKVYLHYKEFSIGDEGEGYPIKTMNYSGESGNDFYHCLGMKFSTADQGQDGMTTACARYWGGGFWYSGWDGLYCTTQNNRSLFCHTFNGSIVVLKMMIT